MIEPQFHLHPDCRAAGRHPPARKNRHHPACLLAGALVSLLALAGPVRAHDAPSGWSYPFKCCSGYDCRPVATSAVSERPEGYVINNTGEVVSYTDKRVRFSPDGEYHWCSMGGKDTGSTICLFVPPRFF